MPAPAPRDSSRTVVIVLGIVGLACVGLALLPGDPIVAAFGFVFGFVAFTSAALIGLSVRVRRSGLGFTNRPTTAMGWSSVAMLVAGWILLIVPSLPWLDPTSIYGTAAFVLAWMIVGGYAVMFLAGLVGAVAVEWFGERSRPLLVLAVLHALWVPFLAVAFLPEIVANRL